MSKKTVVCYYLPYGPPLDSKGLYRETEEQWNGIQPGKVIWRPGVSRKPPTRCDRLWLISHVVAELQQPQDSRLRDRELRRWKSSSTTQASVRR